MPERGRRRLKRRRVQWSASQTTEELIGVVDLGGEGRVENSTFLDENMQLETRKEVGNRGSESREKRTQFKKKKKDWSKVTRGKSQKVGGAKGKKKTKHNGKKRHSTVSTQMLKKSMFAMMQEKALKMNLLTRLVKNEGRKKKHMEYLMQKMRLMGKIERWMSIKRRLYSLVYSRMKTLTKMFQKIGTRMRKKTRMTRRDFCRRTHSKWGHSSNTERFYYDEMYHVNKAPIMALNEEGAAFHMQNGKIIELIPDKKKDEDEEIDDIREDQGQQRIPAKKWICSVNCNIQGESIKKFQECVETYIGLRDRSRITFLQDMDICYMREHTGLQGHSLACLHGEKCNTIFHHIRMLSAHNSLLREVVRKLYYVKSPSLKLKELLEAFQKGTLEEIEKVVDSISDKYFGTANQEEDDEGTNEEEEDTLAYEFQTEKFGSLIAKFEENILERPDQVCACCTLQLYKKQTQKVDVMEKAMENVQWRTLALYIMEQSIDMLREPLVVCVYCIRKMNQNKMPTRSVLNQMMPDIVPAELQNLNLYETILVQKVKPFQAIVRLQTKGRKLPPSELVHGLRGKIVYLPLDLKENLAIVGVSRPIEESLLIMVNGVPTRDKKIWQELVDLNKVRAALRFLKENNELYADINLDEGPALPNDNEVSLVKKGQFEKVDLRESEDRYEHYTIHPLHSREVTGDSLELFQMEKASGEMLSIFEETVEVASFPTLFPTGKGGRLQYRPFQIAANEYRKCRMLSVCPMYRRCIPYIFHLLYESEFSNLCYAVAHVLSTGKIFKNMTAKELVDKVAAKDETLETNLVNILSNMRGSRQYWYRRYGELQCMVRNLGAPTWFLTLSCAEYNWPELLEMLREQNKDLPGVMEKTIGELCSIDPVTVVRHFETRFRAILKVILDKQNGPLGEVIHYFWRREYQARGAPHIHMLLWIKDAPAVGKNTPEEILNFICKYATCKVPDERTNPSLRKTVLRFQKHKCQRYCQRKYKSRGKFYTRCRFGYPRRACPKGKINDWASSVRHRLKRKSAKRTYELPRTAEEKMINDYNPTLLMCWGSNIDIQFISELVAIVCRYVTSYITKGEKCELQDFWDEVGDETNLSRKLIALGLKTMTHRECSSYEAADRLIGAALYGRSDRTLYLAVGPAAQRKRVLKPFKQIQRLAEEEPESQQILKNNMIDIYYPQRADEMESLCLYEVAESFTYKNEVLPNVELGRFKVKECDGCLVRHEKKCLIQHVNLTCDSPTNKEFFFFVMLQLFKPWRIETELLGDFDNYESSFENCKDNSLNPRYQQYMEILEAEKDAENKILQMLESETPEGSQNANELLLDPLGEPNIMKEAEMAMADVMAAAAVQAGEVVDWHILHEQLNSEQLKCFDIVLRAMMDTVLHEAGQSSTTPYKPLLMYISGEAGTGKSFLIQAITACIRQDSKCDLACVVTAPTGLAAYNIGGVTLHRLLMLPVEHGKTVQYKKLSAESAQELARVLKKVRLIIIDEVSMVANIMLALIHLRLQEIMRTADDVLFGGKNILVLGDLLQLTPVKGHPIFRMLSTADCRQTIGSIGNVNLWKYFTYFELTINMRQQADKEYGDAMSEVRRGVLTVKTKALFHSRTLENLDIPVKDPLELYRSLREKGEAPVCLLSTVAKCDTFNVGMLDLENENIFDIPAIDKLQVYGKTCKMNKRAEVRLAHLKKDPSKTAGMLSTLRVCKNCRIMLRRNINVEMGLVNGAMGIVQDVITLQAANVISHIVVKLDNKGTIVRLTRMSCRFEIFKNWYIERHQFPITLAYAVTIHKAQGLTLTCALVDISKDIFQTGMAYVALSRMRRAEGLYLISFLADRIAADIDCVREYNRLRREFEVPLPQMTLPPKAKFMWQKKNTTRTVERNQEEKGKDGQSAKKRKYTKKSKESKDETTEPKSKRRKITKDKKTKKKRTVQVEKLSRSVRKVQEIVSADDVVEKDPEMVVSSEDLSACPPSFSNTMGVNCYGNCLVQVFLNMPEFLDELFRMGNGQVHDALKSIVQDVQSGTQKIHDVSRLRFAVDLALNKIEYRLQEQQDVFLFFLDLLTVLQDEGFNARQMFGVEVGYHCKCPSCGFEHYHREAEDLWLNMPLPKQESVDFLELFEDVKDNFVCEQCQLQEKRRIVLPESQQYLMVKLGRFHSATDRCDVKIKKFRYGQVSIGRKVFTTVGIVYHIGATMHSGHFYCYIRREDKWFHCNDTTITARKVLPPHLTDAYLLFLKRIRT